MPLESNIMDIEYLLNILIFADMIPLDTLVGEHWHIL